MPAPELPTWQDCHELWSKQRRRQQREADQSKPNKQYYQDGDSKDSSDQPFKSDNLPFKPGEPPQEAGQVK